MSGTASGVRPRVRAPELTGRGWLNTGDVPLRIGELRGRWVLLDFWTFCCVNCLHVIDELRPLEEELTDELVVIGVHSPKFDHEADAAALVAAVERYGVRHPVLDDPELTTWRAYTAQAWPTLVLIDPEGYVVAQYAGEGHVHAIKALIGDLLPRYRERGTFQPGASPYVPVEHDDTRLRFPAKAISLEGGGILVADAGHHRVVELADDAETVVRRFGSGERGLVDGDADSAQFDEPNGLCLLPIEVASLVGYQVVVADTANHVLRGLSLATGQVTTLAGDGSQGLPGAGTSSLSSPWDVVWWQDKVWVAMAGIHQLWSFDPLSGGVHIEAGTAMEGLVDGSVSEAWFAQPSGLAADGERLWIADAEDSALRWLDSRGVHTAIGQGLFDFGFRDGDRTRALLQHPLGVVSLADGSVAVADTYNSAVRRFDRETGQLTTLASGLAEVSGLVVHGDNLLAVVSGEHRLVVLAAGASASASGLATATQRPPVVVEPDVELHVDFTPPPGQHLDDRFGPATQLTISSTPESLITSGAGTDTALSRTLRLDPEVAFGVLHIAARAASCDASSEPGAACHLHQQDWGMPVSVAAGGQRVVTLPLGGALETADDPAVVIS